MERLPPMEGQHFAHDLQKYVLLFPAGQGLALYFNFVKSNIILNEPDRILKGRYGFFRCNSDILLISEKGNFYFDNLCRANAMLNS